MTAETIAPALGRESREWRCCCPLRGGCSPADHDASGVGKRAARDAAQRWLAEGRHVRIALPPEPCTDFADMLLADVSSTAEVRNVA
jgi:hypothetical protein